MKPYDTIQEREPGTTRCDETQTRTDNQNNKTRMFKVPGFSKTSNLLCWTSTSVNIQCLTKQGCNVGSTMCLSDHLASSGLELQRHACICLLMGAASTSSVNSFVAAATTGDAAVP